MKSGLNAIGLSIILLCAFAAGCAKTQAPKTSAGLPSLPVGTNGFRVYDLRDVKTELSIKLLREKYPDCEMFKRLDTLVVIDASQFKAQPVYASVDTSDSKRYPSLAYITDKNSSIVYERFKIDRSRPGADKIYAAFVPSASEDVKKLKRRGVKASVVTVSCPAYGTVDGVVSEGRNGWVASAILRTNDSAIGLQCGECKDETSAKDMLAKVVASLKTVKL